MQGSRKIGGKCPSTITVTIDSKAQYHVEVVKTHVGHGNELKHVSIPADKKLEIAGILSSGIPRQVILQKIRSSWTEECSEWFHLTTNKDLINSSANEY